MSLLDIRDLRLDIGGRPILKDVDLSIAPGEVLGLVGESGSGKSMTALSVMQLLPRASRLSGSIALGGAELVGAPEAALNRLRGRDMAMVFQEPMTTLNPLKTIGEQVAEGIRWHAGVGRAEAEKRAAAMLDRVGLPPSRFPLSRYPHQFSGGQRQRVVIAMACAMTPRLLIADEPTSALDVIVQAQILDLLRELIAERKMALLLISHDLSVIARMSDRVAVIRDGAIVEEGPVPGTLAAPRDDYTRRIAGASTVQHRVPAAAARKADAPAPPLLELTGVVKDYPLARTSLLAPRKTIRAVDNASLSMAPGETVALVGRSGCGKSTLARLVLALDHATEGSVRLLGQELARQPESAIRPMRRHMQIVFQDPFGSFDPRQKVERLVAEPLHVLGGSLSAPERRERVAAALSEVGLGADIMDRYPHEFSGGQRQRLSIARALITRPKLIVADEPVSALDVSVRAQILDLFADLNRRLGCAYLFITHDLTVARAIADRVAVMAEGKIVEDGPARQILDNPQSGEARALVQAAPTLADLLRQRGRITTPNS